MNPLAPVRASLRAQMVKNPSVLQQILCEVAQLCPTLWDPIDCSPLGSSMCPWDFPGKSNRMGCHFLLQGIFLNQGLRLDCWHCRQSLPSESTGKPRGEVTQSAYIKHSSNSGQVNKKTYTKDVFTSTPICYIMSDFQKQNRKI